MPAVPAESELRRAGHQPRDRGELYLSVDAVKTHLRAIFRKFELDQLP